MKSDVDRGEEIADTEARFGRSYHDTVEGQCFTETTFDKRNKWYNILLTHNERRAHAMSSKWVYEDVTTFKQCRQSPS
jgi:hypothetical protein